MDPVRFQIAAAVITRAQELTNRRAKAELDYGAAQTAALTVRPLARHLTRLVRAMTP
ncbi:hypothetical protein [Kineococcus terrestris]|uniref:hypothetical protein n=1 Tax=Kineococcus terrestris TaxID=2044856 RepID=UPI0034DAF55E